MAHLLVLWLVGVASPGSAQEAASGFRAYGSLGAGLAVSTDQVGVLGFDGIVGRATVAVGHAVGDLFVVEGQTAAAVFGSSQEDGSLFELGGGVRLDWRSPIRWHIVPAAHLSLALTGDQVRPTVDLSVALMYELTRAFTFGPRVQYGQVLQPDGDRFSTDARYFVAGLAIGYRPPLDEPPAEKPRTLLQIERVTNTEEGPGDGPAAPPPEEPPEELAPELVVLIEGASEKVERSEVDMVPPILFEHDSVQIIPCGEAALFQARDEIAKHEGNVVVEGHADGTGADDYNVDLARRRAEFVRDWLVGQGVDPGRLRVESRGEQQHLTEETDGSRRQLNRRVIIRLEDVK